MPSIDERVVSMSFENQVFEQRVTQTMGTLSKLDAAVRNMGGTSGFDNLEASANKVTLNGPMSALDKLRAKFGSSGIDAAKSLEGIESSGERISFRSPFRAIEGLISKFGSLRAGSTFSDIEKASDQTTLKGLSGSLDTVTQKFSILQGAAAVALGNIASQAISRGMSFAKGFGVGPIVDGLREYETNLKSIQTVQANTDRPLSEIERSLEELNKYSDLTIYNFSEMAKNIGTFTAAGVDLKTATSSIKGIANMAALSGSNSQQAATAMYQLSQAISSGRVGLQDWNSVVNAGMGGKKLQTALATTAIAMGDISEKSVKLEGPMKKLTINGQSFRESIMAKPGQEAWLSSDVLVNTLATLDGRFSEAALSAELTETGLRKYTDAQVAASIADARAALEKKNGVKYTDEQFKALMKLSDSAFKSATEVKTLGQVFDVAKETIASGWSASFKNIFGTLDEAKTTFTEMSGVISGFINATALARNTMLAGWKELGGRTAAVQGIKNVFNALFDVLGKVHEAFREIFPATTGRQLFEMTMAFAVWTSKLNNAPELLDLVKRTAAGFFAVLHIGWSVLKGVVGVIFDLLGVVSQGGGGFLQFTASIGDFLVAVDDALTKGGLLTSFFDGITDVLKLPLQLIMGLSTALFSLFSGLDPSSATEFGETVEGVGASVAPFTKVVGALREAWANLTETLEKAKAVVSPWLNEIAQQFAGFGDVVADAIKNVNFDRVLAVLQTTFLGGIFFAIRNALTGDAVEALTGGLLGSIGETFGALTGHLQAMQKNVQASMILKIALAIGVLAAGVFVLSQINAEDLAKAMLAIAVGLGQLMASLVIMAKVAKGPGFLALPIIAASLTVLAGAVLILAGAMKIFATMSWEDLAKGLAGVGGGLAAIGAGLKFLGPGTIVQGPAILVLAVALNVLAMAVKQFASLSWEDLGKGLLGVAGGLLVLSASMHLFGPGILVIGPGLLAVSFAMSMLAGAIAAFAEMDIVKMGTGILGLGLALATLAMAIMLMPPTIGLQAAGLVVLAIALNGIAGAIGLMGAMKLENLVKGLAALGGALLILSIGLTSMVGTLPGAAALMAAATALALLAPTLAFLGTLKWSTIFKGLAAIALGLGTLAIMGVIAGPALAALGIALFPLAKIFVITAGALFIFAKALSLLGESGSKGVAVMVASITAFVALLPTIIINFIKGLVQIVAEIAKLAPLVVDSLVKIIGTIIQVVIDSVPKLAEAINVLIGAFLTVLVYNTPKILVAGYKLMMMFLGSLERAVPRVVESVSKIIVAFLNALAAQLPKIIDAGAKVLLAFLNGIDKHISTVLRKATEIGMKFLNGIIQNIPKFVDAGVRAITGFLGALSQGIPKIIKAGVKLVTSVLDGISSQFDEVAATATRFVTRFFNAFGDRKNVAKMVDAGLKAAINILRGIADGLRKDENISQVMDATFDIGLAIVDGISKGLRNLGGVLGERLMAPVKGAVKRVKDILGIRSPSRVFDQYGRNIVEGMSNGLAEFGGALGTKLVNPLQVMVYQSRESLSGFNRFLRRDFKAGVQGSASDIRGAFNGLNAQISSTMEDLRSDLASKKDELKSLMESDDATQFDITLVQKQIKVRQDLLRTARDAQRNMMRGLADERKQLIGLANNFEKVTAQLDAAKQALDAATQQRDQAQKSFTDSYSQLPDFGKLMDDALADAELSAGERAEKIRKAQEDAEKRRQINQVNNYKQALAQQIEATKKYAATLQALRAAGLDDATYNKLLAEGTKGQEFASQLLRSGQSGIQEVNKMSAQLLAESTTLAKQASANLYQAGVDAAAGLVKGLESRQNSIRASMERIAEEMIRAIKVKLRIKSPSQVFAEVGKFSAQGVIQGLQMSQRAVSDAAAEVGEEAASAMSGSLSHISDLLSSEIDTDLKITPVLDLSQVQKEASGIGGILGAQSITASASYGQASAASQEVSAAQAAVAEAAAAAAPTFNFEQNNYSPESLSDVEIYRQTKNQLGQLKTALGVPTSP